MDSHDDTHRAHLRRSTVEALNRGDELGVAFEPDTDLAATSFPVDGSGARGDDEPDGDELDVGEGLIEDEVPGHGGDTEAGPLADRTTLTLTDLAQQPVAINTVSGTTTVELWPQNARPATIVEVANTDDWLAAIAAGRAVGVTSSATLDLHPHPAVSYRPLTDAPAVDVHLAWRTPPTHPAVPELLGAVRDRR